jgi:hypothetical protein
MELQVVEAGRKLVYKFSGYRDMVAHAESVAGKDDSSHTGEQKWAGTRSFAEAGKLCVDGWDFGTEKLDGIRDAVRQRVGSLELATIKFDNALVGQYLDVDSFLGGDPYCMLNAYEEPDKRSEKFVRILVDTTYSASVSADDIIVRGSAIVALCDTLNLAGYTTEVWALSMNGGSSWAGDSRPKELAVLVPVQELGAPWDIRSAMFPLAHPSFLRRLVFGVMEGMTPKARENFGVKRGGGYGTVTNAKKGCLADTAIGGADIICASQVGDIRNIVADPVAWVLAQCQNLGVITEAELVR